MMMNDMIDASRQPVVTVKNGEVFTNSRDVAAAFDKNHKDVLRAIDTLVAQEAELALRNFAHAPYRLQSTGEQLHRAIDMNRDGFTLLAMGFTGAKALKWKLRYIEAFNAMEAELRGRPAAIPDLSDPTVLVQLLTEHASKRIEAEKRAAVAEEAVEAASSAAWNPNRQPGLDAFLNSHPTG